MANTHTAKSKIDEVSKPKKIENEVGYEVTKTK